ncbi:efflux RND transporter periplasmic adaptor subunit [Stenotrophomonas maltophilia]|jgi:gold/copper resistance efflux system membrane fusion protein|uniref:efflux RND transporter periplasmic adaptor subunit n=1 Tax=Stenotrophomonas TaxID=40323 RepID=UPI00066AD75F|nr:MULTISPECIES: efflux RND transporter periplasmic adaptor subunit [Stenotrophomonas]ELN2584218.1 efflux RND transporter periplasmic adaptor subunit [Stenotrophomonas maltophilia]ELN2587549.1 efflux RND transporter periplasmic adaptor subunit [Stenotrophomonas maltophilia]ELN2593079.1 efflux RND transporter periplasmic adaptor subunit [Stenotrophomonas maltophilia]ELN2595684.1 efflux RND transporter periplasmic adaptor subunit [Stenotrophomonas maltophilia]MBA0298137.1 efflux RND transporter 
MRKKIRIVVVAGLIAAVGGIAIAARDAKDESKAAAPPADAPMAPQVPVAEVITRTVAPSAEYTGFLAAPKTVELRSRVGGAVDAVSVPEGRLVRKGQLLFQIDPRPFQVSLDTAAAQLQQAEVLASQAQADFDRAERLVATGAVARKTYDDAVSARSARQAQVQAAKAAVAAARLDLSYARVTAPIAGRVDRVLVTEGNLVSGGVAGAATLLTTVVSIDPLHVYFDIDEATYLNVVSRSRPAADAGGKASLPVQVGLTTDKGFPHRGALDFVGNTIDRSTGTIRVRAVVPNPDGRMAPGMFVRAKLSTGAAREAVLIDDQAVGTDQGRNYVLVVGENNQAQYRPIELGPVVDGLRVINGGLQAGEKIIIKGLVRPGMAVTPRMVPMQAPAAPAAGAAGATKAAANAPAPAAAPAKAGGADPAKADGAAGSAEARK